MAIPKIFDIEFLDIKKDNMQAGDVYLVDSEFDKNPKFPKNFLVGTIKMKDDTKRLLSLNKTSYSKISEIYGPDTKGWIGKTIVFRGLVKMGGMEGKLFDAVR